LFKKRMKRTGKNIAALVARTDPGWRLVAWSLSGKYAGSRHPIDAEYGIRTSGVMPAFLIDPSAKDDGEITFYLGCQPSCVRRAIGTLPDTDRTTFYDLGCGQGRALVIASEFVFRSLVGVDLSSRLCATAAQNAAVVRKNYPERRPIDVIQGDAAEVQLPDGDIVAFIYHSFGRTTLTGVIKKLERAAREHAVTVIYENPVHGDMFDASPRFARLSGERVDCDAAEQGHHTDGGESFVIWGSEMAMVAAKSTRTDFDIVVSRPGQQADVVPRRG
jgi:SAM-dependent methyltransferase